MTTPLPPAGGEKPRSGEGEGLPRREKLVDKGYDPRPTQRARDLRNNATPAERRLWSVVRNRQRADTRFNRQVKIKPYICDLVARTPKLVIELDGGQHGEAIAYDERRTAFLEAKGYRVLRFWNNEVFENLAGVIARIDEALSRLPSRPREGRGGAASVERGDKPSPSPLRGSSPPASGRGKK